MSVPPGVFTTSTCIPKGTSFRLPTKFKGALRPVLQFVRRQVPKCSTGSKPGKQRDQQSSRRRQAARAAGDAPARSGVFCPMDAGVSQPNRRCPDRKGTRLSICRYHKDPTLAQVAPDMYIPTGSDLALPANCVQSFLNPSSLISTSRLTMVQAQKSRAVRLVVHAAGKPRLASAAQAASTRTRP